MPLGFDTAALEDLLRQRDEAINGPSLTTAISGGTALQNLTPEAIQDIYRTVPEPESSTATGDGKQVVRDPLPENDAVPVPPKEIPDALPPPEELDISDTYGHYVGEAQDAYAPLFAQQQGIVSGYGDDLMGAARGIQGDFLNSDYWRGRNYESDQYRDIYDQGGFTDAFEAQLGLNRANTDQWARGQREAIFQDMAEKGIGGSGAELAAALGGNANAAQRNHLADLQATVYAQQRADEALGNYGQTQMQLQSDEHALNRGVYDAGTAASKMLADLNMGQVNTVMNTVQPILGNFMDPTILGGQDTGLTDIDTSKLPGVLATGDPNATPPPTPTNASPPPTFAGGTTTGGNTGGGGGGQGGNTGTPGSNFADTTGAAFGKTVGIATDPDTNERWR